MSIFQRIFSSSNKRYLNKINKIVQLANELEASYKELNDDELSSLLEEVEKIPKKEQNDQRAHEPANQLTNKAPNQQTNQPTNQKTNQQTHKPTNRHKY